MGLESDTREDKRNVLARELAGRQHGVVARRQLLALGLSSRSIEHRIARGRLHPVASAARHPPKPRNARRDRATSLPA